MSHLLRYSLHTRLFSTSWQILRNFVQLFTLPMNANAMVLEHAKGLRRFHSRQGSDEGEGVPSAAGKARS